MNVYKITNKLNQKSYIGVTKYSIEERFNQHYYKRFERDTALSLAFLKYGKENFEIELLESGIKTYKELFEKEKYYISKYKSYESGYNLTIGGEGSPTVGVTDEEIIESYLELKSSVKAAKKLGIGENTVLRTVKKYKIPLFGSGYEASKRVSKEDLLESYTHTRSIKQTARDLGLSPSTVSRKIREFNIELLSFGFNSKDEQEIVDLYLHSNYSMTQMQEVLGVGRKVISRILKKHNVVINPNRNRTKPIQANINGETLVFDSIAECTRYIIEQDLVSSKIEKTVREGISYSINHNTKYYDMDFVLI